RAQIVPPVLDQGGRGSVVLNTRELLEPRSPELFEESLLRGPSRDGRQGLLQPADTSALLDEGVELVRSSLGQARPAVPGLQGCRIEVRTVEAGLVERFDPIDKREMAGAAPDDVVVDVHDAELRGQALLGHRCHGPPSTKASKAWPE